MLLKSPLFPSGGIIFALHPASGHSTEAAWARLESQPQAQGLGVPNPRAAPGEPRASPCPCCVLAEKGSSWSAPGATAFLASTAVAKGGCATAGPKGTAGLPRGGCQCSLGTQTSPFVSLFPKNLWERILLFLRKPQIFRLERSVGYSLPHPSIWWVFSFSFVSSRKGHVTPEKIWDFLELTEMAVPSQAVPSLPCCRAQVALCLWEGMRMVTCPRQISAWSSELPFLNSFTKWKSINWNTLWTASGQDQIRCDLQC